MNQVVVTVTIEDSTVQVTSTLNGKPVFISEFVKAWELDDTVSKATSKAMSLITNQ